MIKYGPDILYNVTFGRFDENLDIIKDCYIIAASSFENAAKVINEILTDLNIKSPDNAMYLISINTKFDYKYTLVLAE